MPDFGAVNCNLLQVNKILREMRIIDATLVSCDLIVDIRAKISSETDTHSYLLIFSMINTVRSYILYV